MLKEIPKASGKRTDLITPVEVITSYLEGQEVEKTKTETVKELGFTPKQTHQFQQMAEHEDVVIETTRSRSQMFLRVL